jgi:hypothetical protein
MLTLDQVRAVNDGFKAGDFVAALRPLEDSVDLRPAEMPRLEKLSQATFKTAIQTPEAALFWTEACFHPNVSVRRFARKLILGLKDEAKPLASPLRARILRFLHEERLRGWSTNAREAAERREQVDVLQSAVELLLRADADLWMDAFAELLERLQPIPQRPSEDQTRLRQKWHQAKLVIGEKTNEFYVQEWGEEMRDPQKRLNLPARAHRDIAEKVQSLPEVKALMEGVPADPWSPGTQSEAATEAMHWSCAHQIFLAVLVGYIGYKPAQSEATQEIARRVRVHFWNWIETALLQGDEKAASRIGRGGLSYQFYWLGRDEIWKRAPQLLRDSKAQLLPQLVKTSPQFWGASTPTRAGTWTLLAMALVQSVQQPYTLKEEFVLPPELTPEVLCDLKVEGSKYLSDAFDATIRVLEKQRQKSKQVEEAPKTDAIAVATNAVATNAKPFLSPEQSAEIETKIASDSDIAERVAQLLDPPPSDLKSDSGVVLRTNWQPWDRWDLWLGWARLPGWSAVKERVWSLASPKLWARLEKQIAEYRGATAEEPPSNIAAKLSESEIKKWKSESRRRKKNQSSNQFNLLGQFLLQVEGAIAATKLLDAASSTGLRGLRDQVQMLILHQFYVAPQVHSQTRALDQQHLRKWFLGPEWKPVLEHLSPFVLDPKSRLRNFESSWAVSAFAVGYYRLNSDEGRSRCRELVSSAEGLPYLLAPAVRQQRDVETWLFLLRGAQWSNPYLDGLWDDLRNDDENSAAEILPRVLDILATTSNERSAKLMIGMMNKVSGDELRSHAQHLAQAAESSLPVVTRWALGELSKMPEASLSWDSVIQVAGEKLWSENGALAKDAAKFLGVIGAKNSRSAPAAWEKLGEATALENLTLMEAVFRALSQIRAKNKEFALDENAAARLEELAAAQSERFTRFQKKLL